MTRRRLIVWALFGLAACCGILLAAGYAALHSPWLLARLARPFGYEVSARTLSLSPSLSGSISDLSIKSLHDGGVTLVAANVTAKTSLDRVLQGEVESLVLESPKLTFRIGKGRDGATDFSFLKNLPSVRLLDIRNAEARVTFEEDQRHVEATNLHLTIRNLSPKTGGSIAFETNFAVTGVGGQAIAVRGKLAADFLLTGVYPRPYGKGSVRLVVDSGTFPGGRQAVSLSGLTLAADLVYDQRTETFAVSALRGQGKGIGVITGAAKAVLRGETPWNAALAVSSIDFAQVFAILAPFLPEEYRAWVMQGEGAVETEMQGTYANGQPSFTGKATLSFNRGGFSSPDSTKAAQGVSGKLILNLQYAAPEEKLTFKLRSDHRDGEYLWGKYYSNLAGGEASLTADGSFFLTGDRPYALTARLDLFQTGDYSVSANGKGADWTVRIRAADVSHEKLVNTLLRESLKGLSPHLANLAITGSTSLDATIRHERAETEIAGTFRTTGTTLDVPELQLAVHGIAAELPFDLVYPPSEERTPPSPASGFIRFDGIHRDQLTIDRLQIPLVIVRNMLEVPEPVTLPFLGGEILLSGVQVADALFPHRVRLGVRVRGIDLGRLTRRLTGTEFPGRIDADFGVVRYENDRVASEGKAVVNVFGGEIEATNFFAENLASTARRFGGDLRFRNINLEEVTRRIAVGKMTGIIQGSLKNFTMEYGQPASFTLEVESVEAPGVAQRISMDAIQSISILGTGAGSALNRGITQFFREYPYSKIGIRCVLTNDQFSVNGTIHEGGREYLVRRGFLRGVDVVNQNPENFISFRDMEERIQRIFRTSQAGPGNIETQ